MSEDAARRRAERAERFGAQRDSQRRRREQESTKAQVLVDQFVARATEAGLATVELTARPWSGRGRYRTGVVGWYLRSDRSIGVGTDGAPSISIRPLPRSWWVKGHATASPSSSTPCCGCGSSGRRDDVRRQSRAGKIPSSAMQ
jgi:hypothetical protein